MQELNRCNSTGEVARNLIDKIHEAATKRLKVLRGPGDASEALCPLQQERIEADGGAVGFEASLIVDVDEMVLDVLQIVPFSVGAEAFPEFLTDKVPVDLDGERLVKLCLQGGKGLMRDVGIAVNLAAGRCVSGIDVVIYKGLSVLKLLRG